MQQVQTLKSVLKSKTLWFSVILAVLSVLQGYIGLFNLTPSMQAFVGTGIAAIVAALRVVTTSSVLDK